MRENQPAEKRGGVVGGRVPVQKKTGNIPGKDDRGKKDDHCPEENHNKRGKKRTRGENQMFGLLRKKVRRVLKTHDICWSKGGGGREFDGR